MGLFLDFNAIPSMSMSASVPVPYCFEYCSCVAWSEVREPDSSSSILSICMVVSFFHQHLSFWNMGLLSPLRFIPRYFILFDAMVNVKVSLISLIFHWWFMSQNATDFCVLILYPATLPN